MSNELLSQSVGIPTHLRRQLLLWGLPLVFIAILSICYFSGVHILREFMAPMLNREFGVVENLQNVLIVWTGVIAITSVKQAKSGLHKAGLITIVAICIFLLLEEIDYGLHYYELLMGVPEAERSTVRNLHNINEAHRYIRVPIALAYVAFFSIIPWFRSLRFLGPVKPFIPSIVFVLAPLGLIVPTTIAHALANLGSGDTGALLGNYSEFSELYMYYVLFMYVRFATMGEGGLPIR
jgi:hypothetical protein